MNCDLKFCIWIYRLMKFLTEYDYALIKLCIKYILNVIGEIFLRFVVSFKKFISKILIT